MFIRKRITHLVCALTLVACGHQCVAQNWLSMDKGLSCFYQSIVYELTVDEANNRLLASGNIYNDGYCEEYRTIAAWVNNDWIPISPPVSSIYFTTFGFYNDTLFSANSIEGFDNSNFVKWGGAAWDTIQGGPPSNSMYCMEEHGGYLYASGAFNECAGDSANLVFRYDGQTVEPLVDWFDSPSWGLALAFFHDTLFVGGNFDDYQREIHTLASVYDFDIHSVGQGLNSNSIIEAMAVHDGKLWLGGAFGVGNLDTDEYTYLAYYDGHRIYPSPYQPDGRVTALKSYNNELYMAGWFAHIEDLESHCVAKINDFGYFSMNPDTVYDKYGQFSSYELGIVRDMEIWNDTLYIGGTFASIGLDTALNCVAKLNRSLSGTNQLLQSDISLYPNPTSDNITLETNSYFNQVAAIKIYDSVGRHIFSDTWPLGERKKEIKLETIARGVYFLTVETNIGITTKRLVKN